MTSIITYHTFTGNVYELVVEHDGGFLPKTIAEDASGRIFGDCDREWSSLIAFTHDLKVEVVSWSSDPGN